MPRTRYLVKRSSGSHVLRIFVPTDLIPRFGRKEITRSLRTDRLPEAERLATLLRAGVLRIFEMARQNPALTPPDLDAMAKAYFGRITAQSQEDLAFRRFGPTDKGRALDNHAEALGLIARWRRAGEVQNAIPYFDRDLTDAATAAGLTRGSEQHNALCDRVLAARANYHRGLFDTIGGGVPTQIAPAAAAAPPATRADETLGPLSESFIREHIRSWARKTVIKHRGNLAVCAQLLGADKAVGEITKADVRAVKDSLARLPANWSKLYPGRSPLDARTESERDGRAPMTPGAVNAYLASFSSLLTWCEEQGYIADNPALRIRLPETVRATDKRKPFEIRQLNTIFNAPLYTGMRSAHYWAEAGEVRDKGSRYWIPLVALFSGMRLGEIANLLPTDVREIEGVRCMDITRAKTRAGERKVPVHPELTRLGFLDYVAAAPADRRLFSDTSEDPFSKFFGRFLTKTEILDRKLVFHSFRHTFTDSMRAARIETPLAKALIGHSDGTVTGIYGNGYPVATLAEAMSSVRYDGLDLSHLRP